MQQAYHFRIMTSVLVLTICTMGHAQSFNIDLDIGFGGPEVGAGAPSSSFGAAANQQGFWNIRGASLANRAEYLRTLDGELTPVTINSTSSGGGRGSGWTGNSGDFRLLMNDRTLISLPIVYTFENLEVGQYQVWTYSADVTERSAPTIITVLGAAVPIQYSGLSPMVGNVFEDRVTHAVHSVHLTGSILAVRVENMISNVPGSVNGLQIKRLTVPEPSTFIFLCVTLYLICRLGRHTQQF